MQLYHKNMASVKNLQKKSTQKCIKLISWLRLVCKNSWWDLGVVKCTFACPLEMFVNMCQFTTKIEKPGTSVYCVVITNTQQWSGRLTSTKPRSIVYNFLATIDDFCVRLGDLVDLPKFALQIANQWPTSASIERDGRRVLDLGWTYP